LFAADSALKKQKERVGDEGRHASKFVVRPLPALKSKPAEVRDNPRADKTDSRKRTPARRQSVYREIAGSAGVRAVSGGRRTGEDLDPRGGNIGRGGYKPAGE